MYGEVIKKIRLNKNLSLKSVYTGVCSKTNAIKFEKGERTLAIDKFELVLNHMMLSFSEFIWIKQQYQPSKKQYYYHQISRSFNSNQKQLFKKQVESFEESKIKVEKVQLASLKLLKSYDEKEDLCVEDLNIIINYFSNLSTWTMADLKFFANNCYILPYKLLISLLEEALKVYERYRLFENSQTIFSAVLVNSIHQMILNADVKNASHYLDYLDQHIATNITMSSYKLLSKYYRAKVQFLFFNQDDGQLALQKVANVARYLNYDQIVNEISNLLDK